MIIKDFELPADKLIQNPATNDRRCLVRSIIPLLLLAAFHSAVAASEYPPRPYLVTEQRAPCANYKAERQVFFGDTHVHTAYSLDAGLWDTRARPEDAYRFAEGERIGVPPYDGEGRAMRYMQLSRPLISRWFPTMPSTWAPWKSVTSRSWKATIPCVVAC